MYSKENNILFNKNNSPIVVNYTQFNNWNNSILYLENKAIISDINRSTKYYSDNCEIISDIKFNQTHLELEWTNNYDDNIKNKCNDDIIVKIISPVFTYYTLNFFDILFLLQSITVISIFLFCLCLYTFKTR